jgi:hypothetical protein
MLHHVHFEVAIPDPGKPIDAGGFLIDNENGKRERNPRFCGVPGGFAAKGATYQAWPCRDGGIYFINTSCWLRAWRIHRVRRTHWHLGT